MDPITQGVVGAIAAQTTSRSKYLAFSAIVGALAGMAADLDVFIRSSHDPLLALEYHRQFTHSLFFIPIGGLICTVVFWVVFCRKRDVKFRQVFIWSVFGYATHGLLDGCTSYGTQLLWPLTDTRFSIDIVSVIDPLFTLPALLTVVIAALTKKRIWYYMGITWCLFYLSIGYFQHGRVLSLANDIAKTRGHLPVRLDVKPSFANIVVWKVVYEFNDKYYALAVRQGLKKTKVWEGQSVNKLNIKHDLPWLDLESQQAKDIERFRRFSNGFVALDSNFSNRVVDMRYSLLPDKINALWWIELTPDAAKHDHVKFETNRGGGRESAQALWKMILGQD